VSVSDDAALGVQAVLELGADNHVVIRRGRDGASVKVNGVALAEPTPLIHGDKVVIAGFDVLFSEDKKVGATAFVSAKDVASVASKRSGPARATATTGGRLVSLVDGKEYQIPAGGIIFGREAGSDVVVAQPEVSRKHASIAPGDSGYVITDHSTNGIWVNGTRVQGWVLLARSDVVRVGGEEFRFYADVAKPTPGAGTPPPTPRPPATTPAAAPPSAPASAPPPAAAAAVARPEPTTVPAAGGMTSTPIKRDAPRPTPAPPRPQPVRPKREPSTASKAPTEEKRGGIPAWVWFAIIIMVAVAAYFLGQGRG
jgi:pSer/pThr/pTyr-binding forkhead associated (FHA) protein